MGNSIFNGAGRADAPRLGRSPTGRLHSADLWGCTGRSISASPIANTTSRTKGNGRSLRESLHDHHEGEESEEGEEGGKNRQKTEVD